MHAIIVSIIHVSFGVSSLCCVNPYNPVFITNQTLVSSRCTLYLHIAIFELSGFFSLFSCVLIFMTYNSGQSLFSLPVRLWFFLFVLCVLTLLYLIYLFLFLILVSNPVGTPEYRNGTDSFFGLKVSVGCAGCINSQPTRPLDET